MNDPSHTGDPLDELAEEFAHRLRNGERVTVEQYAANHPDFAEQIRELFPALAELERFANAQPPSRPSPGKVEPPARFGEFRILGEIGRGGMGIVYEAEQESLGRRVALKVLPTEANADDSLRERFHREAQLASRLHHTNIVPVFAVGEQAGTPYYAMQYIRGRGLDEILTGLRQSATAENGLAQFDELTSRLPEQLLSGELTHAEPVDELAPVTAAPFSQAGLSGAYCRGVAQLVIQVAEALAYAHGQGILHRDIKPANLRLDTEGTVWVVDFGLAKTEGLTDLTDTGDIVGTLRYLPPERFHGQVDTRSDLYSLGLTLYELLAQRPAYEGSDRASLLQQVLRAEPTPLRQFTPTVPRDLETICMKCLSKEPAKRYASAEALAEDLRAFVQGRPIRARRVGPLERAWMWAKQKPAVAASLLLAMVAAMALTGFVVRWADSVELQKRNDKLATSEKNLAKAVEEERSAKRLARRVSNNNRVLVAHNEWESNNTEAARTVLALVPPELRRFEWHFLNRAFHPETWVWDIRSFDQQPPMRLAFSADGRHLACGTALGSLYVYDLETGVKRDIGQTDAKGVPLHLAFSPDGRWLAAKSGVRTVQVWDWRKTPIPPSVTTRPIGRDASNQFAFSPDGKRLYLPFVDRGELATYDTANGVCIARQKMEAKPGIHTPVCLSPDGTLLALLDRMRTKLFLLDVKTGALIREVVFPQRYTGASELAFSADGKQLTAVGTRGRLTLNVETGKTASLYAAPPYGKSLAFGLSLAPMPDGRTVVDARGEDYCLRLSGGAFHILRGHTHNVCDVAASPTGKHIASCGHDYTVRVWDTSRLAAPQTNLPRIERVMFTEAGHLFALNSKSATHRGKTYPPGVWDPVTGQRSFALDHDRNLWNLAVSRDAAYVATSPATPAKGEASTHQTVTLWDAKLHKPLHHFELRGRNVLSLRFDGEGKRLVIGVSQPVKHPRNMRVTYSIFDCESGKRLDSWAGWEQERGELDLASARERARRTTTFAQGALPTEGASKIFTPDGKVLARKHGSTVEVWDLASGKVRFTLSHRDEFEAIAFSPDGERLAVRKKQRLELWDVETGGLTLRLDVLGALGPLAFSPDGTKLAVGFLVLETRSERQ